MAILKLQVTVDEDGNFKVEAEDASGDMVEAFDELEAGQATRMVVLNLEINEAKAQELSAKVPADTTAATLEIKTEG